MDLHFMMIISVENLFFWASLILLLIIPFMLVLNHTSFGRRLKNRLKVSYTKLKKLYSKISTILRAILLFIGAKLLRSLPKRVRDSRFGRILEVKILGIKPPVLKKQNMSSDEAGKINRMPAKDFSAYKWVLPPKIARDYFGPHVLVTHDPMFPMHIMYKYREGGDNSFFGANYYLCHSSTLDFYITDRKNANPGNYPYLTVSVHLPRMPKMVETIQQFATSFEISPD